MVTKTTQVQSLVNVSQKNYALINIINLLNAFIRFILISR